MMRTRRCCIEFLARSTFRSRRDAMGERPRVDMIATMGGAMNMNMGGLDYFRGWGFMRIIELRRDEDVCVCFWRDAWMDGWMGRYFVGCVCCMLKLV